MYNLSKDYNTLYQHVCDGKVAACFVDYDGFRDICQIIKYRDYDISICCRGIGYGNVRTFHRKRGTEKELFIAQCEKLNLEWIKP
ncbi:hypothetical protein V6R21_06380 [Limibacter armeniacum]|uniref:hypothetical protein n=1 Tax=Limibacter armeniacum TaxID=466084 RepID=UPI002FE5360F